MVRSWARRHQYPQPAPAPWQPLSSIPVSLMTNLSRAPSSLSIWPLGKGALHQALGGSVMLKPAAAPKSRRFPARSLAMTRISSTAAPWCWVPRALPRCRQPRPRPAGQLDHRHRRFGHQPGPALLQRGAELRAGHAFLRHLHPPHPHRPDRAQPGRELARGGTHHLGIGLRAGVKWHDGRPRRPRMWSSPSPAPAVPNSPGGFGGFLRSIARVEVVDP